MSGIQIFFSIIAGITLFLAAADFLCGPPVDDNLMVDWKDVEKYLAEHDLDQYKSPDRPKDNE